MAGLFEALGKPVGKVVGKAAGKVAKKVMSEKEMIQDAIAKYIPTSEAKIVQNIRAAAPEILSAERSQGSTFNPRTNRFVDIGDPGTMMATKPNPIDESNVISGNVEDLINYAKRPEVMSGLRRGEYMGSWSEAPGQLTLDPSSRFKSSMDALNIGNKAEQRAGFNLKSGKEISLKDQEYIKNIADTEGLKGLGYTTTGIGLQAVNQGRNYDEEGKPRSVANNLENLLSIALMAKGGTKMFKSAKFEDQLLRPNTGLLSAPGTFAKNTASNLGDTIMDNPVVARILKEMNTPKKAFTTLDFLTAGLSGKAKKSLQGYESNYANPNLSVELRGATTPSPAAKELGSEVSKLIKPITQTDSGKLIEKPSLVLTDKDVKSIGKLKNSLSKLGIRQVAGLDYKNLTQSSVVKHKDAIATVGKNNLRKLADNVIDLPTNAKDFYKDIADTMASIRSEIGDRENAGITALTSAGTDLYTNAQIADAIKTLPMVHPGKQGAPTSVTTNAAYIKALIGIVTKEWDNYMTYSNSGNFVKIGNFAFDLTEGKTGQALALTHPDTATIDTHAVKAVLGLPGSTVSIEGLLQNQKAYDIFQQIYKDVAKEYNLTPREFQALVWFSWRKQVMKNPGKGMYSDFTDSNLNINPVFGMDVDDRRVLLKNTLKQNIIDPDQGNWTKQNVEKFNEIYPEDPLKTASAKYLAYRSKLIDAYNKGKAKKK